MKNGNIERDAAAAEGMLRGLRAELYPLFRQWGRPECLFSPSVAKAALVVIDIQNFSCAPVSHEAMPRIGLVIQRINRLADFCRKAGVPVIWVRQNITETPGRHDGGLYPAFHDEKHWKNEANMGPGTEIFPEMHFDSARDHVVFKNRYSAFLSRPPELKDKLAALKRTQLIVAGVAANVCVESTVRDAMQMDYEVILVADGTTATSDALMENALRNTMLFFGDVRTAEEVEALLSARGSLS